MTYMRSYFLEPPSLQLHVGKKYPVLIFMRKLIPTGYDNVVREILISTPSQDCSQYLQLFQVILDYNIHQENILLEEHMQRKIMDVAKQAFGVWSTTCRSTETPTCTNSGLHASPLSGQSYRMVTPLQGFDGHHISTPTSAAIVHRGFYPNEVPNPATSSSVMARSSQTTTAT
jgi:hypothetical protein